MLKKKQKTVSDQLNELINPTPVNFDLEEDLYADTAAKVVENDPDDEDWLEDSTPSRYRQRSANLIEEVDERYTGKKVSRKAGVQGAKPQSDEDLALSEEEFLSDGRGVDKQGSEAESESRSEEETDDEEGSDDEEEGSDDEEDDEDGEDEDNDDYDIVQDEEKDDDAFQHMSRSRGGEVEKGQAIRNQLGLWDQLLEARIRLQKCLVLVNRFPQPDTLPAFKTEGGSDFVALVNKTKQSTTSLLQKLLDLRTERLKTFSETKNIQTSKKRRQLPADDDEEITSSEEEKEREEELKEPIAKRARMEDYATLLAEQHDEFSEYRNATIQKWNDKTRVSIGNVSSRNFSAFEQSTLRQIEQILANRPRLVARTQLKRSGYRVLGKPATITTDKNGKEESDVQRVEMREEIKQSDILEDKSKEHDTEIFDDDDFYHQLLRELIERKTVDVTDPVQLGRQWLELQKIRSKMKRKVDLRATKGRKLRYTVHPKLVNYMAPIMLSEWTEEAKTDLFNSLFGKAVDSARGPRQ